MVYFGLRLPARSAITNLIHLTKRSLWICHCQEARIVLSNGHLNNSSQLTDWRRTISTSVQNAKQGKTRQKDSQSITLQELWSSQSSDLTSQDAKSVESSSIRSFSIWNSLPAVLWTVKLKRIQSRTKYTIYMVWWFIWAAPPAVVTTLHIVEEARENGLTAMMIASVEWANPVRSMGKLICYSTRRESNSRKRRFQFHKQSLLRQRKSRCNFLKMWRSQGQGATVSRPRNMKWNKTLRETQQLPQHHSKQLRTRLQWRQFHNLNLLKKKKHEESQSPIRHLRLAANQKTIRERK